MPHYDKISFCHLPVVVAHLSRILPAFILDKISIIVPITSLITYHPIQNFTIKSTKSILFWGIF